MKWGWWKGLLSDPFTSGYSFYTRIRKSFSPDNVDALW